MRTVTVALALVALLVLVAVGSAGGGWGAGAEEREVPRALLDGAYTIGILLAIGLAAIFVWALTAPGPRRRGRGRRSGGGLTGLLLVAIGLAAWTSLTDWEPRARPDAEPAPAAVDLEPPRLEERSEGAGARPEEPRFQWWLAGAALAAVAATAAYVLVRRPGEEPSAASQLEAVLTAALDELDGEVDADPRRAVIQSYARMERVLAAHDHPRLPHEAPHEYLARILRTLDVRAEAAHALTELFERAKFSRHEIDAEMRAEAVASLEAVRDDLRAAA